jgi:DNA-directed RNA polymerase subunit RPC12/RpoP
LLKQIQMYICSNPKCQKKFDDFIIVHDNSKMPADIYYACPYCLLKLDPTATQVLKKDEILVEENIESDGDHLENFVPTDCPHYLGYLFAHFNDAIISKECLLCSRMSDCSLIEVSSEQ